MIRIDDFLADFDSFRDYCNSLDYAGVTNPADGVFYPGVSLAIPGEIADEVREKIERIEGVPVSIRAIFLRLSTRGMEAPHQAHTDAIMGKKSFMLYLSEGEGGTALVRHVSGMDRTPVDEDHRLLWERDTNTPDAWQITDICEMRPNRACIFDADLMHRAEPVGGFGENSLDGRLVLTAFYEC